AHARRRRISARGHPAHCGESGGVDVEEADMSIRSTGALAAAVLALSTMIAAQTVPSQFVVSGRLAEQIQDFSTINLATAERIAETCEKLAAAENVAISIYVLDNDGNHVYMDRMDGQGYLNIITA